MKKTIDSDKLKKLLFRILKFLRKALLVALGAIIIGISINLFYRPVDIIGGGLTAISILSNIITGTDVALLTFILNIPILIIGYIFVDKEFMLLSVIGNVCLTASIHMSEFIPPPSDNLLTCIVSGSICVGIGAGLQFRQNGSCGGFDVLCRMFNKYFSVPMGNTSLIINGVVLLFGCYFLGLDMVIATIVQIFLTGRVINYIVEGVNYKRTVIIVSVKADQIADALMMEFNRGLTLTEVTGAYSGKEMKQIMCTINPYQTPKIRGLVRRVDENAFLTVTESISVIGGGFKASEFG